ncbi:MAG TPA: glycerol-3-phosphate dehydrogenase/oxidase [Polyangiaceae bacterium]|nr:glycerol-3-phosphate dehydrogenase/oxidase [Polyangiaceae bacterium]
MSDPAVSVLPPPTAMPVAREPLADATEVDVAVVGGGINGTGVARDLALRGLRVALFERNDLAFGASGNSSGMIHGGVRYLSRAPHVTETSCRDSGYIQRIAPHLLFRIPFLMPVRSGPKGRVALELIDAYFRAYDDYQPLKRGEPHCRLDPSELAELEPGLVGAVVGGITFDEWGVDGARLCVLNAIDAIEHGGRVYVHTTVDAVEHAPARAAAGPRYVVTASDRFTLERVRVRARVVVNATGAWSPVTAALGGLPQARVRVRPGKGIHVVLDRRVSNYGILSEAIDGRQIFVYPWQNVSLLGTTDDDYYGDLDDVQATSEEVRYLVQGVARVFPAVREARAIGTYAGVRPTLYAYGTNEDALSREHEIVDHTADGAPGVYSMIGGKLASYRLFAQEMADRVARGDFESQAPCTTHVRALPGGDRAVDAVRLAERHGVTPVAARRLVYRHGSRAERVLERIERRPGERDVTCPCEPVLEAEVRHVVADELARTVDDVSRRTRLGLGACGGMRCAARCGQIVAEERGLSPREGGLMAGEFLVRQARSRLVALGPVQARQEALALAHLRSSMGQP